MPLALPRAGEADWIGLDPEPLPVSAATSWAVLPGCGAVVSFAGTVRDHAEGRPGVVRLEYEAYADEAVRRLRAVAVTARSRWPVLGRLALLHRVGPLAPTDVAVVVVVSAPHRAEAFDAARWCIDTLKAAVPIWKRETWRDGVDWGTGAEAVSDAVAP